MWHMGVSQLDNVWHTFMIPIWRWPLISRSILKGIWHVFMRGCIASILDPDTTSFDLKVKCIGFMTWLCVWTTAFLSFDIVILCLADKYITIVWCLVYSHDLCMTLYFDLHIKIIYEFKYGKIVFALWLMYTSFWHMVVSLRQHVVYILDLCMTLTFDLYMGGRGNP